MNDLIFWNEKLMINLSLEAIDDLCCAREPQSVMAPDAQSDSFWDRAQTALKEGTR